MIATNKMYSTVLNTMRKKCPPTFDELVEQLLTTGEFIMSKNSTSYTFKITMMDWINWVTQFKTYILYTTEVFDHTLREDSDKVIHQGYSDISIIVKNILSRVNNVKYGQIQTILGYDTLEHIDEVCNIADEISTILSMDPINQHRLNKTIQDVEFITNNIMLQGSELTDHRSHLELITEEVDHTAQTIIIQEQLNKVQYDELSGRILFIDTSINVELNTIKIRVNEQQLILDLFSTHIKEYVNKTEEEDEDNDELRMQINQLHSEYLQLDEHVSKIAIIHQQDIKTMETYITNIRQRLAWIEEYGETPKKTINFKYDIIETKNQYNKFVDIFIILTKVSIISYVCYKCL